MDPDRSSPHWNAIVGNNWPAISPANWRALERLAREGAATLDLLDAENKRRVFDDQVISSVGLDAVKEEMLRRRGTAEAFADALNAAADTYQDFSDLVYRTRNQILDIVDRATRRIQKASREAAEQKEESDAEAIRGRIPGIIAGARAEVEDVMRTALQSISPHGLPSLDEISKAFGLPGPWGSGDPRTSDYGPGHRRATDHSGPRHDGRRPDRPETHQVVPLPPFPDGIVGLPEPDHIGLPLPTTDAGEFDERPGRGHADGGSVLPPSTVPPPSTSSPGGTTTGAAYAPAAGPSDHPGAAPGLGLSRSSSIAEGSADHERGPADHETGTVEKDTEPGARHTAAETGTDEKSAAKTASGPDAESSLDSSAARSGATADPAAMPSVPMVMPTPVTPGAQVGPAITTSATSPTSGVTAASTSVGGTSAAAAAAQSSNQARSTMAPAESRGPTAVPKVTAGPGSNVAAPSKSQPPNRDIPQDGEPESTGGSNELVRDVVGAAMASSAAPAFVLGSRVDGDLVLARTILGGVLAAGGASVVGLGWSVSVMRHPGGISAFVTSNEGRGWLPAGLYLPREVSTPWVWEVSDGFAWEGVADPARVLAEFGLAWGRKSGAHLTAVVSSEPIDTNLRRQLGDVPAEGEVGPSSAMDLSAPRAGLVDRLGLVGAPALVSRAVATPEADIGTRCVDLATDAHVRIGKAGLGSVHALDAPAVRERILAAVRQGKAVSQDWWEELRDADDLLAASMLSRRVDVSRVALGELRSEQSDARSTSELTTLRGMVFERRCDELVLLLENEPTRQSLRDAMYAHTQLIGHPAFDEAAAHGPAPDAHRAPRRPTITAGPGR
ncbi:hypothetical protein ACLMAL_36250 [Nocardia sp. CWNU-33]|uniref:hypothetical protein n=1 Tax=Nocardia sp. CWNU-33 TaxID=3392117 RepID=UPI00398E395B